jgi:predicted dithiol-disulfide oxidoreductase (DUF899 family)
VAGGATGAAGRLAEEKELTRRRDSLNAARRGLPMVRVGKDYVFDGPDGTVTLAGLFHGCSQLVVHHVLPWYSSHGSDFNYDFQVTLDKSAPQLTYNYRQEPGLPGDAQTTEMPGASAYSAYARGPGPG